MPTQLKATSTGEEYETRRSKLAVDGQVQSEVPTGNSKTLFRAIRRPGSTTFLSPCRDCTTAQRPARRNYREGIDLLNTN
ncbi:hypothetical protein GWI33_005475 [Rhynchophorus ferrugineus]|uniref:Uncharacterized protein n=1 Tax=Rhynchophorus ferrugineus TaxID=354439 RepID=A0A834MG13_RHYFE|nr:hypothetical protein GWI33_005475 [Rhynchophorus ferrugineus]